MYIIKFVQKDFSYVKAILGYFSKNSGLEYTWTILCQLEHFTEVLNDFNLIIRAYLRGESFQKSNDLQEGTEVRHSDYVYEKNDMTYKNINQYLQKNGYPEFVLNKEIDETAEKSLTQQIHQADDSNVSL